MKKERGIAKEAKEGKRRNWKAATMSVLSHFVFFFFRSFAYKCFSSINPPSSAKTHASKRQRAEGKIIETRGLQNRDKQGTNGAAPEMGPKPACLEHYIPGRVL